MNHYPHRHTVSRSIGNRIEQEQEHTRPGAAYRFDCEADAIVRAFGMADTVAGVRFVRSARKVATAIANGEVVEASMSFEGERITYEAPKAARPGGAA